MIVHYRFLNEKKDDGIVSPVALAYTGFFDEGEFPCYVTMRGPRERDLHSKLENLTVQDVLGDDYEGTAFQWSEISEITISDEPTGWVPFDMLEEKEKSEYLRKIA